jgi:hypothetical protein
MDLPALAQQITTILAPALPFIYVGSKAVVDKKKEILEEILYEKDTEKIGSKSGINAKALLDKIRPEMSESLERALTEVSKNPEDLKAKEETQQEILKLLMENPNFARKIELTVNFNAENVDQLAIGNYNNFYNYILRSSRMSEAPYFFTNSTSNFRARG